MRSATDSRRLCVESSLAALAGEGAAEAASKLIAPVARLFDGYEINAGFVQRAISRN
jgi:hypothetical protein